MDSSEVIRTIEDLGIAETLVRHPKETIEPKRHVSTGGKLALEALKRVGGSLEGRIAVLDEIGQGGMGVVHLAQQETLGRRVAIKTLRGGANDMEATLRILREAWVTGALEHPNVVPVYDVGVDAGGAPFIVMKRVEGRSWSDTMRDEKELRRLYPAADALEANVRILLAVTNAIHFAHDRSVLHRDIKPENVMIGAFGEVYVLDWGIAVSLKDDPSGRLPVASDAREIAGTPSYMAPEMILGDPTALSPRTDVYLLGAVLYEIITGSPPHAGTTLEAVTSSILLSSTKFPGNFPPEARQICERAMSREPGDRFASAAEFRSALEDYLAHRGSRKLAWEAKRSLSALLRTLEDKELGEERTLAAFNLLGECRFGYRAALSAWPGNEAARRGLDRALLAVIEHELAEGDPAGASTLLREMSVAPPEVAARVDTAVRARAAEDERLRKLHRDLDPEVGGRTRTFIGGIFGLLWTFLPLVGWKVAEDGAVMSHAFIITLPAAFLLMGLGGAVWARETLTKTLLNRRLMATLGWHLVIEMVLGTGAWLAGLTPLQNQTMHILLWAATETFLAVWVERWFAASAIACGIAFLGAAARPDWIYWIMSACNFVFTLVLVRVWLPKGDVEAILQRRQAFRKQARRMFLDPNRRSAGVEDGEELP